MKPGALKTAQRDRERVLVCFVLLVLLCLHCFCILLYVSEFHPREDSQLASLSRDLA